MTQTINPSSDDASASKQEGPAETQQAPHANDPVPIKVWDLPIRIFHWSLVITLCVSAYTGLTGGFTEMDIHMQSGMVALALVAFRIGWGVLGSHYARFTQFVRGPRAVLQSIRAPVDAPGHSPLGALSIVALLVSLLVQISTGLFANDDIFTEGPLASWVTYETSRQLTAIHETNIWILGGLIALHLSAISYYELRRGKRLILAMVTGRQPGEAGSPEAGDTMGKRLFGLALFGVTSAGVYWLTTL